MDKTVLIVDDSDLVRKLLGFSFTKAGYKTLLSIDGEEALSLFDGQDIDMVITDLNMPNMDGLAFIKEIRTLEDYRFLPIILFVSDAGTDIKHFIRTSGATMVFDKNVVKEKLLPTVKKLIG